MTLAGNGGSVQVDGLGTVASFAAPLGLTVSNSGVIYVADANEIRAIVISTMNTLVLAGSLLPGDSNSYPYSFNTVNSVALSSMQDYLYVSDHDNGLIRRIKIYSTDSDAPSSSPTEVPTAPAAFPTASPSKFPTVSPSGAPSVIPTAMPSTYPTLALGVLGQSG
jgi:DNA-binding beta-propeller fold protein YncE